jgi:uncharacterized RDD family membrane protein YckC
MDWHYVALGKAVGPIPEDELKRLAAAGHITRTTLLWRAGMPEWQEARLARPDLWPVAPPVVTPPATPPAAPPAAMPAAADPPAGGAAVPPGGAVASPGGTLSSIPGPLPVAGRYGGFWIRFLARIIDWLILWVAGAMVKFATGIGAIGFAGFSILHDGEFDPTELVHLLAAGLVAVMVKVLLTAVYEIAFLTRFGATPGKMALGLKVVRASGAPLSFGRAVGRYFAYWLSCLTAPLLWVGFWIAGIDKEKRALHDFVCDTRVVRS